MNTSCAELSPYGAVCEMSFSVVSSDSSINSNNYSTYLKILVYMSNTILIILIFGAAGDRHLFIYYTSICSRSFNVMFSAFRKSSAAETRSNVHVL